MLHAFIFILLGAVLVFQALDLGGPALLLLWPALSFFLVAAAYGGLGPGIFGKRPDGSQAPWALVLLLPFLLLLWGLWHLQRFISRERPFHEIVPGLWLGRRPLPGELPAGVALVVDLTAEFPAACRAAPGREYRCLPLLDAAVPRTSALPELVAELAGRQGVYLHCAQGHGRSGLVAAAVLLARGLADNPAEAVSFVRTVRPGVRLRKGQRRYLEMLHRRLREPHECEGTRPRLPLG
jgi:protein-tyrosine phosphatase